MAPNKSSERAVAALSSFKSKLGKREDVKVMIQQYHHNNVEKLKEAMANFKVMGWQWWVGQAVYSTECQLLFANSGTHCSDYIRLLPNSPVRLSRDIPWIKAA